mmetsp:Transcript_18497/g.26078  ORF Transcript_18497/g.26078 Transcript_18497/m.26078 type:complete len:83 (-) Transcript_18497:1036-1284(-)
MYIHPPFPIKVGSKSGPFKRFFGHDLMPKNPSDRPYKIIYSYEPNGSVPVPQAFHSSDQATNEAFPLCKKQFTKLSNSGSFS